MTVVFEYPECMNCGKREPDMPSRGPYSRKCRDCRSLQAKRRAEKRAESGAASGRVDRTRPKLVAVVQELVPIAERLEVVLEERQLAGIRARATLREFNDHLKMIGRVGQSLLNTSKEPPKEGE